MRECRCLFVYSRGDFIHTFEIFFNVGLSENFHSFINAIRFIQFIQIFSHADIWGRQIN